MTAASQIRRRLPLAVKTAKALQAATAWIDSYDALHAGAPFGGYEKNRSFSLEVSRGARLVVPTCWSGVKYPLGRLSSVWQSATGSGSSSG